MPAAAAPISVFYSYTHEDESLRDELQNHLMILERRGVIRSWHDRAIVAGRDWGKEIDDNLRRAELVLLLVSADFIASDYSMGVELELAMQRQRSGAATVVPIVLREVDLQPEDADAIPFVALLQTHGLPTDLKPVTSWPNRDAAWTDVARGLRAAAKDAQARRPAQPAAQADATGGVPVAGLGIVGRVVDGYAQCIDEATKSRGGDLADAGALRQQALQLLDVPESKRVLWVDDRPHGNAGEAAALAKLQIDVVAVTSTDAALARLAADAGGDDAFDLVISDWERPADGPQAGLQLLRSMRASGHLQPVVYYHGERSAARRDAAAAAGAFGEAALPNDLMRLVIAALQTG